MPVLSVLCHTSGHGLTRQPISSRCILVVEYVVILNQKIMWADSATTLDMAAERAMSNSLYTSVPSSYLPKP